MHKQTQANSRSQPTTQVANQNPHRYHVILVDNAPKSGMQLTESGSTHSAQSSAQKSSPPRVVGHVLARPAKRPGKDTLHTMAYNCHKADQHENAQQITEIFHLSDDSIDEYKNSQISDQTELDTEPDTNENDNADGTRSITYHPSGAGEKQTDNRVSTVRISTTSRFAGNLKHKAYPCCTSTNNTK